MAKTTAPLFGFGASGSLGKAVVFAGWRGVGYARRHVVPANPKSTGQVLTRDIFRNLGTMWKQGGPIMRTPWDRFAVGQKFLGSNAYTGKNIAVLRGDANLADYIGSPGAKGGLPPTSIVLTTVAAGGIECAFTVPAAPTGWTLTAAQATMLKDRTPEAVPTDIIVEGEDLTAPYTVDITGLDTVLYWVQAWLKWTKPDSSLAYGASIASSITVT